MSRTELTMRRVVPRRDFALCTTVKAAYTVDTAQPDASTRARGSMGGVSDGMVCKRGATGLSKRKNACKGLCTRKDRISHFEHYH